MDIKLKNKRKIRNRVIGSLIAVLVITFIITIVSYIALSKQFIISQTKDDLKNAGILLEKNFFESSRLLRNENNSILLNRRIISDINLLNKFLNMQTIVLSEENEVVFPLELWDKERIRRIKERISKESNDFILYEHSIKKIEFGNKTISSIILLKRYDDVKKLRDSGIRILGISFLIGIVFAVLIGISMGKRIYKPLKLLNNSMNEYMKDSKTEIKIYKSNDEIEEIFTVFSHLTKKINNLTERQKQLFQDSSHELKTPLMSIQGYAEAIRDKIVTGDDLDNSLDIIISETQRLKNIIDDVIYLSKIDSLVDEMAITPEKLNSIISESVEIVYPMLSVNNLKVEINCGDIIFNCDREKIKRIFINLISNASRYAKSKIIINAVKIDSTLSIDVIDDGNGFELGQEEKVFDRFYNGKKGGSGIGLALTKEIVHLHNGEIIAINNMNYGAIFKMTFRC